MQNSKIEKPNLQLRWQPAYWIAAAAIPILFFAFQAITNSLYPETRALNGTLPVQLAAMFLFYALWVVVPVLIWRVVRDNVSDGTIDYPAVVRRLFLIAAILCPLHLLLLAFILRLLYSPPGWGFPELVYSFGEVCLSNAALWLTAYGAVVLVVVLAINSRLASQSINHRYEIRQNGKIWSIDYSEIYWIKAAGNYAELHTAHGVMMVRKSLGQISRELDDGDFIASHRSILINGQHVVSIKPKHKSDSHLVELTTGDSVPLSRRNLRSFRDRLQLVAKATA